ncbi:MAG: CBS domain-containing protein [Thermoplasmatota archaeon]
MAEGRIGPQKVADVMAKNVVTVDKDDRLERVLRLMEKNNITKIPVTDGGAALVGIVTDAEVADELGSLRNIGKAPNAIHVSGVMKRDVPTLSPEADIEEAIELAKKNGIGIIPIVYDKTIVGVITKADLLPFVTDSRPVKDIMATQLHAVAPTDRVIHARRMMIDNSVERLPVLDQGALVGMIAEADVALGLAKFKEKFADNHQAAQLKEFRVDEVMIRTIVKGDPSLTIKAAARLLHERHVGALPITLNGSQRIAGMVTRTDLIRTIKT